LQLPQFVQGPRQAIRRFRLSKRIGRPLADKCDKSRDSSCPGGGREFGDPIAWEVGYARKNGAQVVANRDIESPTGFDNRDDSSDLWTGSLAADMQQFLRPTATGRIAFSAKLFETSG
jgi:hypothetical protein